MPSTDQTTQQSREAYERACHYLPGGVTGDGRTTEPYPIVFQSARGKWLTDVDHNTYLDYHCGFGSVALGYANPTVDDAVKAAMDDVGTFVGVPNCHEERLAERLCELIPCAELVAFCGGGGSDALYHAVRVARAATGRRRLAKLEGGYQGWHSDVGVSTKPVLEDPSPLGLPPGYPNSKGVLPEVTAAVSVVTANNCAALEELFRREGEELAAILIEPVLYSPGCIAIDGEFLRLARSLCDKSGTALIFDEVMTGFRNGLGGAGAALGVTPDLAAFGKAMANGYIISALAGRRALMSELVPIGQVFYSGTFNGHPIAVTAAQATISVFESEAVPARLADLTTQLTDGINTAILDLDLDAVCQGVGGVWNLYFGTRSVRDYRDLAKTMTPRIDALNNAYRQSLAANSIYLHKRHMNRGFLSAEHSDADIARTVEVTSEFLASHTEALTRGGAE